MHHLFQRGKLRSQAINVPEGLPELLSDIAREVLRCQPTTECLCQFIIDYLHAVINARDKATIAKTILDRTLRIVDDVIADLCICDIPQEKSDYMSQAMEECFKRFLEQRRCEKVKSKDMIKINDFDLLDELVQKCKFTDDELRISKPVIETAYRKFVDAYLTAKENDGGTDCLYQYFQKRETARLEQSLREKSAIKIQSNFRGYLVRKSLFLYKPIQPSASGASETELEQNQLNLAALKIQRFFRRHQSELKSADIQKANESACSPVSSLSLAARPADHPDTHPDVIKDYEGKEENQNEKDQKELPSNVMEADEGDTAADTDLNNETILENSQND